MSEALKVLTGGLGWSVSFLLLMQGLHELVAASTLVALMWPIKIGWSTAHTWVSRQKGKKAKAAGACASCAACCVA